MDAGASVDASAVFLQEFQSNYGSMQSCIHSASGSAPRTLDETGTAERSSFGGELRQTPDSPVPYPSEPRESRKRLDTCHCSPMVSDTTSTTLPLTYAKLLGYASRNSQLLFIRDVDGYLAVPRRTARLKYCGLMDSAAWFVSAHGTITTETSRHLRRRGALADQSPALYTVVTESLDSAESASGRSSGRQHGASASVLRIS